MAKVHFSSDFEVFYFRQFLLKTNLKLFFKFQFQGKPKIGLNLSFKL